VVVDIILAVVVAGVQEGEAGQSLAQIQIQLMEEVIILLEEEIPIHNYFFLENAIEFIV